eukprot:TRINITY_DN83928_c0_g1_i1.p1 TRINITY_DN83928_c0_g1~~TRINITY_DN83928_c0_g1_i1.p1  ORF type:complete len:249 (+),score=69.66 TRINITY_DN83928_c0_g1_i1:92-838(+)
MEWKKILPYAVGLAGAGAVLWYLLKEEKAAGAASAGEDERKKRAGQKSVDEITKEDVRTILKEILASQEQMKSYIKNLTEELLVKSFTFDEIYKKVKDVQPADPLHNYGLSMVDFDKVLDKHQQDPDVREAITKLMGAPAPKTVASDKVQSITQKKVIEVHQFMLEELDKLCNDFANTPGREGYDSRTVTIAAQAIVGSKIEAKFSLTSEDIESAVLLYHAQLATDKDFAGVNIKIQHAMGKLMGAGM